MYRLISTALAICLVVDAKTRTALMLCCLASGLLPAVDAAGSLKEAYGRWFSMGVAASPKMTAAEQSLLVSQFNNITSQNCLKPAMTQPSEGQFTFSQGDALVDFAQKNGLKVNGHTLIWHVLCPEWFFSDGPQSVAGRDVVLKRLRDHIAAVVGRYKGRVASWDVVNEALATEDGQYLRPNKWLSCVGSDYVCEAFLAARKADPAAELYYNDYHIERPAKRAKALRLIQELRQQGARVDGIGIQGHWGINGPPLADIEDSIVAFHAVGLKVMITELDINVVPWRKDAKGEENPYANGCPEEVLQRQAEIYRQLFTLFRKHADKIDRVTLWTLHDGLSWLNWPTGRKIVNYPLLWDRQLQPKPAFFAVMAAAK